MEEAGHQAAASVERAAEGPKGPRAVARLSARAEIAVEQASRNSCHITFDQVAQRITRALLTCKYMADPEFRFLAAGSRVAWPQYVYDGEDRKAQAENQSNLDAAPPRFRPTARDLSQLDEAMAWFRVMNLDAAACAAAVRAGKLPLSPDQRLIWWRATGRSTATVARYLGVSDETARRRTNAAYARLHAIAERAARDALSRARRLACGEPAAARREHSAASLGRAARGAAAAGA
jgi:DNA-binding CsgD family transcriptional regulator